MDIEQYCLFNSCVRVSQEAPKATDWLSVALTCASLLIAIVVAWYAFRTFSAANKSVKEANRSAQAAEDSLALIRASEVRRERAYLLVKGTSISVSQSNPRVGVAVTIQNFGLTPGTVVSARSFVSLREMPLADEGFPDHIVLGHGSDVVAQSAERTYTIIHSSLTDEQIEQMRRSKLAFVVKGELDYEDVFGNRHRTTFQWFLSGEMEMGMALGNTIPMWVHPEGNSAT
jgi:hypothetical protein